MGALTGNTISSSYLGLLKTGDNAVLNSTLRLIEDGGGTDASIKLSTTQLGLSDGTTTVPSLTFSSNSDTGFYYSSDVTYYTLNGTTQLAIGSASLTLNNDSKLQWGTSDVYIKGTTSTDNIQMGIQGATKLTLHQTTGLTLAQYGSGSITGTVTQRLGVTSAGQVVEIPIGGGAVDGSGTAGKITKWTDSDTIGDSILSESGSTLSNTGIFRTSGGSAGSPAYAFTDATNTGMFIDGGNLKLSNAGDVGLYIDGNGNTIIDNKLGVGATSLTRGLTVSGAGALGTILASDGTVNTVLWGDASGSNHGGVGTDNNYGFNIYQNGGVAIEIDTSKNATFAGTGSFGGSVSIGVSSPISGFNLDVQGGDFRVGDDANQGFEAGYSSGSGNVFIQGYNRGTSAFVDMIINNSLTVLAGGNATFAGSLDVGNFTFSGSGIVADSNMTIQTDGGSVNAITLASDGDATFAGEISSGDDINVVNGKLTVNNTSAEVRIKSTSDTGESFINFADPSDNNVGQIYYGHGTNKMSIRVNDATRLEIDSSGNSTFAGDVDVYKTTDSQLQIKSLNEDATLIINSGADGVGGANREEGFIKFYQANADFWTLGKRNQGYFSLYDHTAGQYVMQFGDNGAFELTPANNITSITGSVGIGTTSVASGGANTQNVQIHNSTANSTYLKLSTSGTGATASDGLDLIMGNDGTGYLWNRENSSVIFATNNTERLRIDSDGHILLGTDNKVGWRYSSGDISYNFITGEDQILTLTGGTWTTNATQSAVRIKTQQGEKLTVLNNGNVGIGTTSPDSKLQIMNNDGGSYRFGYGGSSDVYLDADNVYIRTDNGGANTATFTTMGLGIGTTAPEEKLMVAGAITSTSSNSTGSTSGTNRAIMDLTSGGVRMGHFRGTTAAGSGYLGLYTDSTERMRITSAGNVKIGSSTTGTPALNADDLVIDKGASESGITLISTAAASIRFGDAANTSIGLVEYNHNSNYMRFSTNNAEALRILSGGQVCIGTTSTTVSSSVVSAVFGSGSDVTLKLGGHSGTHTMIQFLHTGTVVGSVSSTASATAFNTSSDYRLKEDLQDFNALEIASKIKMYDFKWKADDSRSYGVMAHELEEVLPQAVTGEKDAEEMQSVDYSKLVPILLKSIQELEARVQELEKEI